MATQSRSTTKEALKAATRPRKQSNVRVLGRLSAPLSAPLPEVGKAQRSVESLAPQAEPVQFLFRVKTTSSCRSAQNSQFVRVVRGRSNRWRIEVRRSNAALRLRSER